MPIPRKQLVFMDSGIGGIPYLKWVQQRRPGWHYAYLADNKYFPYGSRTPDELKSRLTDLTSLMIRKYSPDIIIIACNTASVAALSALRALFSVPFVGVVPAVKPAAQDDTFRRIGVLATQGTVDADYLKGLIQKFVPDTESVDCLAAPDLVQFVETRLSGAEEDEIRGILYPYLAEAEKRDWSHMVLGCTHYIFLKPWLEKWKKSALSIIDSTEGVGRRILNLLEGEGMAENDFPLIPEPGRVDFHITEETGQVEIYRDLADREKMKFNIIRTEGL
jgi:glutamate racemase